MDPSGKSKGDDVAERKPGAGLGFLFPPEETPTARLPVVPEVPAETLLCPACGGSRIVHVNAYDKGPCSVCSAAGFVDRATFDRFIAEHPKSVAARQLKRKP
jgi:hypothetical protein